MTTPNNQPTPPEGMEILTDYTKPLPEEAKLWIPEEENISGFWNFSANAGRKPSLGLIYAIPITVPATGDAKDKLKCTPEHRLCSHDQDSCFVFSTGRAPCTREKGHGGPHVSCVGCEAQGEDFSHNIAIWKNDGDTTNEKGGGICVVCGDSFTRPTTPGFFRPKRCIKCDQPGVQTSPATVSIQSMGDAKLVEQRQELHDTESLVCADILERQRKGIMKYGTTVAENPLTELEWLQHAYEESLDLSIYLKRLIQERARK